MTATVPQDTLLYTGNLKPANVRPRIYIAGPMTGQDQYNYPAFHAAERLWSSRNWLPLNPATNYSGRTDLPYSMYLRAALQMVGRSDAIALLPGWEKSRGALLELHMATLLRLPIYDNETGERKEISAADVCYHAFKKETLLEQLAAAGRDLGQDDLGQDDAGGGPPSPL